MNEEVNFEADKPAPKTRKKSRKPARRARASKPENRPTVPFPGLTRMACATACNANGCAISGKPYCAHPTKGGLQTGDMGNPAALKRLQDARDQITVRLDPDRFR